MKPLVKTDGKGFVPTFKNWLEDFWGADKFLDDDFFHFRNRWMTPAVNILENKEDFEIDVAAPGMEKKDFSIRVENGMLCISAEKEESMQEKEKSFTRKEFSYHSFERTFALPENVDPENITAKYDAGVLKLRLKKVKSSTPKIKKVAVN